MNFTAPESQTIYDDTNRTVKVRKQIDQSNWDEATTFMDSLGRTIKTVAKDSQGDVIVETHYDSLGRVDRVTNPYRAGDTVYWSKTRYDELGRAVETFAPAELENLSNAQSLGVTSFGISSVLNYVGTVVTTTDASGRKGRSITNGLGQLIRVDEPVATGGTADADLGAIGTPAQPTIYKYDVFGKMVEVIQGVQHRYFKYDALGRLLRVRQPEQEINPNLATSGNPGNDAWTAGFAYDLIGNVVRATDANGVNIINEYDKAGRVVKRCYTKPNINTTATTCAQIASGDVSIDTPAVSFWYDGKGLAQVQTPHNFAKGKLTKVTSSVSETQNTLFDNFGRITESKQITDGNTYTSRYTYNFAGALVEEEYPSGRKVKNEFETDGDLARVTSAKNAASVFAQYVSNFSYTASGGISQMRLGNGRWETAKFNNRMQVTELGLGTNLADANLWKTAYEFGELNTNGTVDTAKNTGNIARQTLSFNGLTHPLVQSYKYDALYRITEATETSNSVANWFQVWGYDRYGNRTSFTQNIGGNPVSVNPSIDMNTNRFNAGQGFTFDKNGNIITDVSTDNFTRTFVFNGDNKQTEVKKDGVTVGRYFYDGEGKRVKKISDLETTIFVYSSGKLVAEYSTATPPATPTVNYTTSDHLGSPRVITDAIGQVTSRRDFLPFGEEVTINVGARSTALKYGSSGDNIRQKFTGYQKDSETSIDFAEARMYDNRFGRFTAVDPLLASGKSANPQTFNRFIYVGNNPIIRKDPNGKDWVIEIVKQKVEVTGRNGKISTREIEVRKPLYVPPGEGQGFERAPQIWAITVGENTGKFRALHPTENRTSDLFNTREDAQVAYNEMIRGTDENPIIKTVVFESGLNGNAKTLFSSPVGHVANAVNNETFSWEGDGYEANRGRSFDEYLKNNFAYRSGTVFEMDFGSPAKNRAAAEEIRKGPQNPFFVGSGYNLLRNNCGETTCRITERLDLPRDNSIAPFQHFNFINENLRPYIRNQQRFVFGRTFGVPPVPQPAPTP